MNIKNISLLLLVVLSSTVVSAQKYLSKKSPEITKEWKDYSFSSTKAIVENIEEVSEFSIFSKVLKDKKLLESLEKEEMVTIFVFIDNSFAKLDEKQRESILENKNLMSSIVKFTTIPGRIDKHGLQTAVKKHNGTAYLTTLSGEDLGVTEKNNQLYLVDSEGRMAAVIDANFYHKNGLFHIVDGLMFPSSKK